MSHPAVTFLTVAGGLHNGNKLVSYQQNCPV